MGVISPAHKEPWRRPR